MYFKIFETITGDVIQNPATYIDFGNIKQGHHCDNPVILQAFSDIEASILNLIIYLESKGGWSSDFGYYLNNSFQSDIKSGSDVFEHFTEVPNAQPGSDNGIPIQWSGDKSDYIWLDVDIPFNQRGNTEANYRFIFNYN